MGLLTLSLFLVQCSDLNAEKVKKDVNDWFTDLITPRNSSLELANEGYIVKGNLKNKPNQKLALYEMTPENLIFIDSVITDKKGDFLLKGSTKELIFCALGVNDKQMIYLALDNSTEINVMIDATVSSLNYSLSGKHIEESVALKDLLKLNEGYVSKIKALETEASSLNPNTDAGLQRMSALQKDYYTTMAARSADMLKFAQDRPSSFIPFFILQFNVVQEPTIELLTAAKDAALKANPNSKYTEIIVQRYNDEARLMIGGVAPEINLAQPEGSNLALSSLRGKYVLIDFWASWCGPCRKENPNNVAMYNKYKDKGFEIYGVSLDQDPLRWKKAIEADGLTWKHVSDLKGWSSSAGQTYNIRSIPATVLIAEGNHFRKRRWRG